MTPIRCLITGVNFLDVEQQRWIHGDLHQLFSTMIVDASGCEWSQCAETPMPPDQMAVLAHAFYEKNNVIVFPLELTSFNEHAHNFLRAGLDAEAVELSRVFTFDPRFKH